MLWSPFGRVEPSEGGTDNVSDPLGRVKGSVTKRDVFLDIRIARRAIRKKRNRVVSQTIDKMKIARTIDPEVVFVPTKGRRTDLTIDGEELMDLFPSSWGATRYLYLLSCIIQLAKKAVCLNVRVDTKHSIIVEKLEQ
jgi:hypothetical protein